MDTKSFVKTYVWAFMNGRTSLDIAKKYDIKIEAVYVKANQLRKRGVKLPYLQKESGKRELNVEQLNEFIAQSITQ